MQGLFINGQRPKSKKAVREALVQDPTSVRIEATSMFGDGYGGEYAGRASDAPIGVPIYFVGPDPYTRRNFYGQLIRTERGFKLT